jgi:cytochrome b pre-mRNA-processing protein 3
MFSRDSGRLCGQFPRSMPSTRLAWRRSGLNMLPATDRARDAMLTFLFRRLTDPSSAGAALFDSATREARLPHWYVEGKVPDTLDGRFAVLTSIIALILVRLEAEGDAGNLLSVGLTEQFIHVMESEHRELGLGDPTLGKTVRRLVGALEWRTDAWRLATSGERAWATTAEDSLHKGEVAPEAVEHCAEALRRFWAGLEQVTIVALQQGELE